MRVQGVGVFWNVKPSRANILIGRIESDSLRQIADRIAERFIAEG